MSLICKKMNLRAKHIFAWMVSPTQTSFDTKPTRKWPIGFLLQNTWTSFPGPLPLKMFSIFRNRVLYRQYLFTFCSWIWRHIHGLRRQSYGTHSLTHSLTHSILINLFIKVKLNTVSPTSPAKYCFCPIHFLAYVWLVCQGTREG